MKITDRYLQHENYMRMKFLK